MMRDIPVKRRTRAQARSLWNILRWPAVLALVSVAGLVSALVGDGILNVLSWLCLGSLVAVTVYFLRR